VRGGSEVGRWGRLRENNRRDQEKDQNPDRFHVDAIVNAGWDRGGKYQTSLLTKVWSSFHLGKRTKAVTIYAAEGVEETIVPSTVDVAPIRSRGKNSHTRTSA